MRTQLRPAFVSIILFSLLTGIMYTLFVQGLPRLYFPTRRMEACWLQMGLLSALSSSGNRSAIHATSGVVPRRPNRCPTTLPHLSGSNLGPTNPKLAQAVSKRIAELRSIDAQNTSPVPVDLVTASASGLDPHISIAAANYQVSARGKGAWYWMSRWSANW